MPGRREFLVAGAGLAALSCGPPGPRRAGPGPPPRRPVILLRSGWRTDGIGEVAHTPGLLRLLASYLPGAELLVWSNALGDGVAELLRRNFPDVRLVSGDIGPGGAPGNADLAEVFERAGFLLHGSGSGVAARAHLEAWRERTGKPYGILGVTIAAGGNGSLAGGLKDSLDQAAFVFTRETRSLENLKRAGIRKPQIGFAPDGAFSFKLSNEERAVAFLKANGLAPKKFLAVVPRLRAAPGTPGSAGINQRHQEGDHALFRAVIESWVRRTGCKALLCPEMSYQLEIIDPLLYDPLPAEVKRAVVRRTAFWLPDEAASVCRRASAVLSFECHSAILAAVNDTPPLYVHQPEDGIKGQMWKDIGLGRWYFEVERTAPRQLAAALEKIQEDYPAAQADTHEAVTYARKLQADAMDAVRNVVLG